MTNGYDCNVRYNVISYIYEFHDLITLQVKQIRSKFLYLEDFKLSDNTDLMNSFRIFIIIIKI